MDELIARLVANAGLDKPTAETAIGIILGFLRSDGPPATVEAIIKQLPGAENAIAAQSASGGAGGLISGSLFGGGLMAAGARLMSCGIGMGQIPAVAREILGFAREKVGSSAVDEIIDGIPGLRQYV